MADAPTAFDIVGITGGLATLGAGFKWLFGRADRREKALDAKEAEYVSELKAALKQQGERLDDLEDRYRKLWMAFGFVATGLHARDPLNPSLRQAANILGDAFPIDLHTPKDMTDTLSKLG